MPISPIVPIIPIVGTTGSPITQLTVLGSYCTHKRAGCWLAPHGRHRTVGVVARKSWSATLAAVMVAGTVARAADLGPPASLAALIGHIETVAAEEVFDPDDLPPRVPDAELLERRTRDRQAPSAAPRAGSRSTGERRPATSDSPPHHEKGIGEESIIVEPSEHDALSWLVSSGTQLHRGHWYFAGDAVLLHRSTAPRQNLTFFGTVTTGGQVIPISILMDTETDGFQYEPGMRLTLGRYLGRDNRNRDHLWEFNFLGLFDWESAAAVTATPGSGNFLLLAADGNVEGFNFAQLHEYSYTSDLNSFELNYKLRFRLSRDRLVLSPEGEWQRECTPGWTPSFLGGVRVITVDETFGLGSVGFQPTDGSPPDTARYDIRTNNNLVGLQIGAELLEQHCNWSVGVRTKLGGLVNFASQESLLQINVDPPPDFPEFREASDTQLGFLAELGLVASYHFRPNIALRASYDFLYVQGLALGPQQLQFNFADPPDVVSGNHIFYDGASVGLEIVW
jgi:hypothetical protein